jgi:hypothetical protein
MKLKPLADRVVVLRNAVESGHRKFEPRGPVQPAAAGLQALQHHRVLVGAGDDGHGVEILGCGAHHGRAADVDVLDGFLEAAARLAGDGLEGIEVDHGEVDARDVLLRHHRVVFALPAEQAAMDTRVQCLDAPAHDLGEAGVVGHLGHGQVCRGQRAGGAAGTQQAVTQRSQAAGEFDHPGLVGNADQRRGFTCHWSRGCRSGRAWP